MLDWIGSLRVRENTSMRVALSLSRSTRITGLLMLGGGVYLAVLLWPISPFLLLLPALLIFAGVLMATLRRDLVFDREAGVLRVDQRALGLGNQTVVPLFHLRAVVIIARPTTGNPVLAWLSSSRFIAFVDRRIGDAIYLDESRRCATLLRMAEAIAEVAEVRLEYDAMSHAGD